MAHFNTFENKSILVTGAGSGIGREIAIQFAKLGGNITLWGRNLDKLNDTKSYLNGENHTVIAVDLCDTEAIISTLSQIEGKFDVVIHSAGVNHKSPIKFITEEKIQEIYPVNVFAPILLTKELVKQKKLEKGGNILFISSISSQYATISNGLYGSSKGAIDSFIKVAALELSTQKIRVNGISPGLLNNTLKDAYALGDEMQQFESQIPLGRLGETKDVANAAIFLCSEAAAWITGINLVVDGGTTLR